MRYVRITLGALVWALLGWWLWQSTVESRAVMGDGRRSAMQELLDFAGGEAAVARIETADALDIEVGDPIFLVQGSTVRRVGEVHSVRDPQTGQLTRRADATAAEVMFYGSAPAVPAGARLAHYDSGSTMDWALSTMMPAEKRAQVAGLIKSAYKQHQEEILNALLPLVQQSLREGFVVVERDLPAAIKSRSARIEALGRKYQKNIIDEKITPLVKTEVWPIVQRHAKPMAEEVGQELWNKMPKWGLAWRKGVDYVPFTSGMRARNHFDRYVTEEAMPLLEEKAPDFVRIVQEIMREVGQNEQFRKVMRDSLTQMIEDPELRQVVWEIVREVIIDNPALGDVIAKTWTGPEAKAALDTALRSFDPTVNQISQVLFGNRESGFTPEFARVLRAKILRKDRRWFVLVLPSEPSQDAAEKTPPVLPVERGDNEALDPFLNALAQSGDD